MLNWKPAAQVSQYIDPGLQLSQSASEQEAFTHWLPLRVKVDKHLKQLPSKLQYKQFLSVQLLAVHFPFKKLYPILHLSQTALLVQL